MRRIATMAVVLVLLIIGSLFSAPVQCANDICAGIAYDTCSALQADLVNACYRNFPNGGPEYQQCLDNSWNSYNACMTTFGCARLPMPIKMTGP